MGDIILSSLKAAPSVFSHFLFKTVCNHLNKLVFGGIDDDRCPHNCIPNAEMQHSYKKASMLFVLV